MTPLDILRRTPKTNCGDCGHPTCLAFAAAVATSGFPPEKCPFINFEGLVVKGNMPVVSPSKEKDLALLQYLKSKIADLDFSDIHMNLGAAWDHADPDTLYFTYLGQKVLLNKSLLYIDDREPEDHRDQILLYNYIHSCGGRAPTGNWIALESLPNSISKTRTLAAYCEERLATLFSDKDNDMIFSKGKTLGGKPSQEEDSSSLAVIIPVLPMVPHYILFWESEPDD